MAKKIKKKEAEPKEVVTIVTSSKRLSQITTS